jgi:diacylglycerol kinase family enzyme
MPSKKKQASPSVVIAPESKLNDGLFHVTIARGPISRYRLLRMVMLVENGTHSTIPGCEIIKCTAFRLEPEQTLSSKIITKNNIDGEAVEDGIVQASVISNVVHMFHKG